MKEELVSFTVAQLAMINGFKHQKANVFGDNMCYQMPHGKLITASKGNIVDGFILAPTQALLQKWFRETHKILIEITWTMCSTGYEYVVIDMNNNPDSEDDVCRITGPKTYEQALELGLETAFKLIKE